MTSILKTLQPAFLFVLTPLAKVYKTWDTWYTARKREQTWAALLASELAKNDDPTFKYAYQTLVNNQYKYCRLSDITTNSEKNLAPVLFKIGCAAARQLKILNNIVGFQPISGPVGLVYHMSYQKNPKFTEQEVQEVANGVSKYNLTVIGHAAQAGTRNTAIGWTPEIASDLKSQHGLDIEDELVSVFAHELASSYVEEVLSDLAHLGTKTSFVTSYETTPDTIPFIINQMSADIGEQTRRGRGNFIVCSPAVVADLQSNLNSVFIPVATPVTIGSLGLQQVGTVNDIKVFTSPFVGSKILVGYKGANGETDVGYILSPYVLAMSGGVTMDLRTFMPQIRLFTRYAKWAAAVTETSFSNAYDYYRTFNYTPTEEVPLEPAVEVSPEQAEDNT